MVVGKVDAEKQIYILSHELLVLRFSFPVTEEIVEFAFTVILIRYSGPDYIGTDHLLIRTTSGADRLRLHCTRLLLLLIGYSSTPVRIQSEIEACIYQMRLEI